MKKYLVALYVDGRETLYRDYQIIEAIDKEKAVEKYNEINQCSYFYGEALATVIDVDRVEQDLRNLNDKKMLDLSFDGSIAEIV